ncbi:MULTISPECIES: replication initiation protein [unclassified Aquimarina]|uniref:replication initiation protein n=1 Tax=unclassified Aquimarina TaxID=2627091 RepID=UPI001E5ACA3D|nr:MULTISPECIES: replication initiation protein [unclassified Aquimarina]
MIKAGELVDVVEVTPLTLTDRKIYNLLIDNADKDIAKPVEHSIDKEKLQLSRRGNERIDDTIERLMGGIAKIKTIRNGESATLRVQLLGRNIEHTRKDGKFYYTFDPILREVFSDSTVFARLKTDVMLSFNGKYALALYEMTAKRINMRKTEEIFSITEFRNLLNVPKGKLKTWNNFKSFAIDPAVAEVNQLATDFRVEINGIKQGRSFVEIEMKWWRTAPDGEESAINELTYSKTGRKARREGTTEEIILPSTELKHLLTDQAQENARKILMKGHNRMGLQNAIQQWEEAFSNKERPDNPNGAFIAFCKKIA